MNNRLSIKRVNIYLLYYPLPIPDINNPNNKYSYLPKACSSIIFCPGHLTQQQLQLSRTEHVTSIRYDDSQELLVSPLKRASIDGQMLNIRQLYSPRVYISQQVTERHTGYTNTELYLCTNTYRQLYVCSVLSNTAVQTVIRALVGLQGDRFE